MNCCEWCISVHWRLSPSASIVTHLVTRLSRADLPLRRSFHAGGQPAVFLVRAVLLIVWLQLSVSGFRPVLAHGWHMHAARCKTLARTRPADHDSECSCPCPACSKRSRSRASARPIPMASRPIAFCMALRSKPVA